MAIRHPQPADNEWVSFPGGELEGRRPKALCPACREAAARAASTPRTRHAALSGRPSGPGTRQPLCFACYRADLDRQKAIAAAGRIDTATAARFQDQLPFEPIDRPRLEMLKADRASARRDARASGTAALVDRRRHAQIAARHALHQIAAGLNARAAAKAERDRAMASAFHAAELQLPEAWIPFVMSR